MARYITARTVGLAMIPLVVGACANPVGSEDMGWLRATITDAREVQFEGTGWFSEHPARDEPIRLPVRFTIASKGVGASVDQDLIILGMGAGVPPVGVYSLAPLEEDGGVLQGLTVYYSRHTDVLAESFTAVSGELEITLSNGDRIEGTFRYVGSRYCSSPSGLVTDYDGTFFCGDPNTIDPSAPRVEVSGSFAVVPREQPTRLD